MSGTDQRARNQIQNPGFFRRRVHWWYKPRPQAPFARLVREPQRKERGFTYLGLMVVIALMGFGLAAYGELYSHVAQREKERELIFIGGQFRDAIASYYNRSPGAKVYPKKLADLVQDERFPMPQHHLRRVYRDPITGSTEWGLVDAPGGGFMGVYSRSEEAPIKTGNFDAPEAAFEGAESYTKWMFTYSPAGSGPAVVPAKGR